MVEGRDGGGRGLVRREGGGGSVGIERTREDGSIGRVGGHRCRWRSGAVAVPRRFGDDERPSSVVGREREILRRRRQRVPRVLGVSIDPVRSTRSPQQRRRLTSPCHTRWRRDAGRHGRIGRSSVVHLVRVRSLVRGRWLDTVGVEEAFETTESHRALESDVGAVGQEVMSSGPVRRQ